MRGTRRTCLPGAPRRPELDPRPPALPPPGCGRARRGRLTGAAGLHPRSRLGLWRVIEGVVADGKTELLTAQCREEVGRLASQFASVDRGRVIAARTPTTLKADLGTTVVEIVPPTALPAPQPCRHARESPAGPLG